MSEKMREVGVEVCFYRREEKRFKCYEFRVECETCDTDEIAEKLTERLVEEYSRKTGITGPSLDLYRDKVYKAVKDALQVAYVRGITREIVMKEPEVAMLLSKLTIAQNEFTKRTGKSVFEPNVRLGLNSMRYVMAEVDSKKKECIMDLLKVIEVVYNEFCKKCMRKFMIIETMRGFHLIVGLKLKHENWRFAYMLLSNLNYYCLDKNHLMMSLKRGYATLSITKYRRSFVFSNGRQMYVYKGIHIRYSDVLEKYAEMRGLQYIVQERIE